MIEIGAYAGIAQARAVAFAWHSRARADAPVSCESADRDHAPGGTGSSAACAARGSAARRCGACARAGLFPAGRSSPDRRSKSYTGALSPV